MKILLDECVTKRLKPFLIDHEVYTVSDMKWNGFKNGKLMLQSVQHGFNIILTIDKNMLHQQNLDKHLISLVVLNTNSSKIEDLLLFLPNFNSLLEKLEIHKAYIIDK